METLGTLFHWSPRDRRPGITRRGLLPKQRPTCTHTDDDSPAEERAFRQSMVCLAPTPSAAWSLSGQIFAQPGQTWDLWQARLVDTDAVHVQPYWGPRIVEVRVANRIPKSRLWWVAERTV